MFIIEFGVVNITWRRTLISFRHASLCCLFYNTHQTLHQSNIGVLLERETKYTPVYLIVSSLASSYYYYCPKRNSLDKMVLMQLKGWYSKLQRDEVVAEWKRVQGKMSLHVHCHISGGNFLHNIIANLRFYIFRKELPVVSSCSIKFWHHYVQQLCLCLRGHTHDSSMLCFTLYYTCITPISLCLFLMSIWFFTTGVGGL